MTKQHDCTEERFLNDVKDHKINIVRDDGEHRFVRFRRTEGGSSYWFDLITWPGQLCISGDCGTYVFSRISDMFEFFRMDKNDFNYRKDVTLNINPYYWGEKLQSIGTNAGYLEFDEDKFRSEVKNYFDEYMAPEIDNEEFKDELWGEIEDEVLSAAADGQYQAHDAIYRFKHGKFEFIDFFDRGGDTEKYTFHYIWCLYAIVWGIRQYDLAKQAEVAA